MRKYKKLSGFQLYAWGLMPNPLHLLLREGNESEPIDKITCVGELIPPGCNAFELCERALTYQNR